MNINEALKDFNLESKFDYEAYELDSEVIAIFDKDFNSLSKSDDECWVVLDKTCIYALSGGEEPDKGWIEVSRNRFEILNCVKAPNGQHLHLINSHLDINVGDSVKVICDEKWKDVISANHTAEHLLQGTLQKLVDHNLKQCGVNLTHNSLSVSFEHKEKLSDDKLKEIENYINDAIAKAIPVEIYFKTLEDARALGVRAKFDNVYSKVKGLLRIVKIDDIYTVLCAGRHAHNTKDLEEFHILKISSKGSNVWKIDAVATKYLIQLHISNINKDIDSKINNIKDQIMVSKFDNQEFIDKLYSFKLSNNWDETINNQRLANQLLTEFNKLFDVFNNKQLNELVKNIVDSEVINQNEKYHLIQLDNKPSTILNNLGSQLIQKYHNIGFVLINVMKDKIAYALIKNADANVIKPNELIKQVNGLVGGRGGGKDNQCQGSCTFSEDNILKIKSLINDLNK